MVDCVSISTSHLFGGNPIYEQHRLRHECIVERQSWNVPTIGTWNTINTTIRQPVTSFGGIKRHGARLFPALSD